MKSLNSLTIFLSLGKYNNKLTCSMFLNFRIVENSLFCKQQTYSDNRRSFFVCFVFLMTFLLAFFNLTFPCSLKS
jgi:hypothetical protein